MKQISHFNSAIQIINLYNGKEPFAIFIKKHFHLHKKFGSTDRRKISQLCFGYFRLGHAMKNASIEDKILASVFLSHFSNNELLDYYKPEWNKFISLPLEDKLIKLGSSILLEQVFTWKNQLSEGIDHLLFCKSYFTQPDLFIRARAGKTELVKSKLISAEIIFQEINSTCFALSNSTKIDKILDLNKDAVVQDYSSQRVGEYFEMNQLPSTTDPLTVWDCCAASGGKSIMAIDRMGNINLTVSDKRETILINLKKRFEEAGIKKYSSFVADLSDPNFQLQDKKFDLIIADLPCSGSGTWGRNPDALCFFDEKEIERYSQLQKKIFHNIIPALKPKGKLLYITCSVFKKENEENIAFISEHYPLQVNKMKLLKGYQQKADTLFIAEFSFKNTI